MSAVHVSERLGAIVLSDNSQPFHASQMHEPTVQSLELICSHGSPDLQLSFFIQNDNVIQARSIHNVDLTHFVGRDD